jgi:cell volume regulation protein A
MEPTIGLMIIGLIIFVGFFSARVFKKTSFPDVLILIAIGLILGPITNSIKSEEMISFVPYFAPIALVIMLFEGGLTFNISGMTKSISSAFIFTFIMSLLSLAIVTIIALTVLNWSLFHSLLLGAVLSGTTAASTIGLLRQSKASEETKNILNLESTITDALTIIFSVIISQAFKGSGIDTKGIAVLLSSSIATAIVIGIAIGLVWIPIVKRIEAEEVISILTFGSIIFIYALVEYLGGSGAIGIFLFALTIANKKSIPYFKNGEEENLEERMKSFMKEISFFIRTFFFVYIGLLLIPSNITIQILIAVILLIAGIVLIKYYVSKFFFEKKDRIISATMIPKGLAAAVLANYPALLGAPISGFTEIVLATILTTNIIAAIGVFYHSYKENKKE